MTNPFRGELEVNLGNKTYKTRMTVDSLIRLETSLGQSIVQLTQKLSAGHLSFSELSFIIQSALKGGGNDIKENEINQLIYESGITEGLRVCGELLANVLQGGQRETEKKQEEQELNLESHGKDT